jgi:hypothetical protein
MGLVLFKSEIVTLLYITFAPFLPHLMIRSNLKSVLS